MKQSSCRQESSSQQGLHVAIIMDGNGRWAMQQGKPRIWGHRAGVEAVRRVVKASPALGVNTLTLYAFSADNWKRPHAECRGLMALLEQYLRREASECIREGIAIRVVGRRDRLPWSVRAAIQDAERRTQGGRKLQVRIAVDYSSRDALVQAAATLGNRDASRESFSASLAQVYGDSPGPAPEVDLLVRTSGEQRLSDFLLWECAYAELYFTQQHWPDFNGASLKLAVDEFHLRGRRFGGLQPEAPRISSFRTGQNQVAVLGNGGLA